ncbi:sld1 [Symbiodinium sp. KB8]|nr:sld1 [Symbiodinium sp. KB8]
MGFMSHDLLHNGVFPSVKMNSFFGWLSTTVFFGISSSQWKEEHNVHHAITNQVHEDLQFTYLPVFLLHWKELLYGKGKQLPWWSTYVLRIQCFLLVPICIFIGRFNIYQVTFRHALGQRDDALRIGQFSLKEVVGLGLFWAYFLTLCSLLPSASHIAVYVVMSHWLVGILHLQLLLNHMAMEFFQGTEQQEIEWFRVQLSSSRNIRKLAGSNWMTHWFHGGLQYQIEHHLFPRLPRHNLGQVAPRVRALCKKYDVPYVLDSFLDTVWDVLKDMYNNYWQNKPVIEANIKQYEA